MAPDPEINFTVVEDEKDHAANLTPDQLIASSRSKTSGRWVR